MKPKIRNMHLETKKRDAVQLVFIHITFWTFFGFSSHRFRMAFSKFYYSLKVQISDKIDRVERGYADLYGDTLDQP